VSQSGISSFLHHIKLTFKKRVYTQRNKIGPTSPRPVRRCGKNSNLDPKKLVFIDGDRCHHQDDPVLWQAPQGKRS